MVLHNTLAIPVADNSYSQLHTCDISNAYSVCIFHYVPVALGCNGTGNGVVLPFTVYQVIILREYQVHYPVAMWVMYFNCSILVVVVIIMPVAMTTALPVAIVV